MAFPGGPVLGVHTNTTLHPAALPIDPNPDAVLDVADRVVPVAEAVITASLIGQPPQLDNLRFTIEPANQIRINVDPAPPPVSAFNRYSANGVRIFKLNTTHQANLQDVFNRLKGAILPNGVQTCTISFSRQLVTYRDPSGAFVAKDLNVLKNTIEGVADLVAEAEEYLEGNVTKHPIAPNIYAPGEKGGADGFKPLIRSNIVLNALPMTRVPASKTYANNLYKTRERNPTKHTEAEAQINKGEKLMNTLSPAIDAQILQLTNQIALNPPNKAALENDKRLLENRKTELDGTDVAALYTALAFYPTINTALPLNQQADAHRQAVAQHAVAMKMTMEQDIAERTQAEMEKPNPDKWKNWPLINRFYPNETRIEPNSHYPKDAAALMFSGLDPAIARMLYADYCRDNQLYIKDESIEDMILRSVINSTADTDNVQRNRFFAGLSDPNMQQVLNNAYAAGLLP